MLIRRNELQDQRDTGDGGKEAEQEQYDGGQHAAVLSNAPGSADPSCLSFQAREVRKVTRSLPLGRLPKLDLVALRIHDPAELAEFGLVGLVEHLAAFAAE